MKRKYPLAMLLLLILIFSFGYWVYVKYYSDSNANLQASGTIEAVTVDLTAKTAGTLKAINFNEGDLVKKDQVLVQLGRNDLSAQRERDSNAVAIAQANLDDLISGSRAQEIRAADASVNIARINKDKAQVDLNRAEQLAQAGAIAQDELEQARVNLDLKNNQLEAALAQLNLLQEGSRPDKIIAAKAEVERTKAILKATDALMADLDVICPLDGTVLSKNFELGEYATAGASLATIADLSNLTIRVFIPTDELPLIKLGQTAYFTVTGRETQFEGTVSHIASQGEFTPKTIQTKQERTNVVFAVKIQVSNPDLILKPGMPADVTFVRS